MTAIPDEYELERCVSPEKVIMETQTSITIEKNDRNSSDTEEELPENTKM